MHAQRGRGRGCRGQDFPGAGGPQPPGDLRIADPWRMRGEGPDGAFRHLAAGGLAASRRVERCRPGERPARGTLCLLLRGAARNEAADRLDHPLSRLLDGARRSPRTTSGEDGRMSFADTTAKGQSEAITLEFDLPHPPEKVW